MVLFSTGSGERLVYVRPDGVKYRLHAPPNKVVMSEEGFGLPPLEYVVDRAPFQHGDTVRSFHLNPRPVQLVVLHNFCSRAEYWDGRASLLDAIRPNRVTDFQTQAVGKLLYYLANGQKRQLDVLPDSGPGFAPPQGGWREWSFMEVLRFTAHDPAWYDPAQQSAAFSIGSASAVVFPIVFPITFAETLSVSAITYAGSWLEYPSFTVAGPVTGLRIVNLTTGQVLQLNYSLPAGYSLTITLRGIKSIQRSDGVNLLNHLSDDSNLSTFALLPDPEAPGGINNIQVGGSGTTASTVITMHWHSRYIGI